MHHRAPWLVIAFVAAAAAARTQTWSVERHRLLPGSARALAAADFDGDGDSDLVLSTAAGSGIAFNDGSGRFGAGTPSLPSTSSLPFGTLAVGDIDGDGDLDLAASGFIFFSYIPAQLLRNDLAAGFTNVSSQWPTFNEAARELLLVDYDGDGDRDIVSCARIVGQLAGPLPQPINRLYLNNGSGVFTDVTATHMPNVANWNNAVDAGDIDGDGDVDLAFATGYGGSSSPSRIRVFVQNASGAAVETPGLVPASPIGADSFTDVALGDHDLDGDLDLAAASASGVQFFTNNGAGAFTLSQQLPDAVATLTPADFDGDGRVDLLATRTDRIAQLALGLVHYRCTPAGFVDVTATTVEAAGLAPDRVLALDLEGDGDVDVIGDMAPQPMPWHNDGQGRLCQLAADGLSAQDVVFAASADMDGDGDHDAAFVGGAAIGDARRVVVARGNAGGPGSDLVTLLPFTHDPVPQCVAWIDADLDLDLDLFVGVRNGVTPNARDRLFHNVGGAFVDVTTTHMPPLGSTLRLASGDVDRDGVMDVVTNGWFYRGNGTGGFVDATNLFPPLPPSTWPSDVALLDFDGDLDLDVVQTFASDSNPSGTLRLLRNDWPSVFADVTAAHLPAVSAWSVATLDIDRDGRRDLLLGVGAGATNNGLRLFRSVGTSFVDETATRLPGILSSTMRSLAVRDFDGDGWDDALCHGQSEMDQVLLRNVNGVMVQVVVWNVLPYANISRYPAAADFDGDGDVDLVDNGGVVTDRTRDLQNAVPPRLGCAAELVLHARAGNGVNQQLALLLLAPQRAVPPLPLGSAGTLFLDPPTAFLHSAHAIAAGGGEAVVPYAIGTSPTLLGATLFAQALFVHQPGPATWRLGNVVELSVRL